MSSTVTVRWIQPAHYRGMEEVVTRSRVRRGLLVVGNIVFVRYKSRNYKAQIVALPDPDAPTIEDIRRSALREMSPWQRSTPNETTLVAPSSRVSTPLQPPAVVSDSGYVNSSRLRGVLDTTEDSELGTLNSTANRAASTPGHHSTRLEEGQDLSRDLVSAIESALSDDDETHKCIGKEMLDNFIYIPCSRAIDRLLDPPEALRVTLMMTLSVLHNEVTPRIRDLIRGVRGRRCISCMENVLHSSEELNRLVLYFVSMLMRVEGIVITEKEE